MLLDAKHRARLINDFWPGKAVESESHLRSFHWIAG